jgi:8-oxo-dGTP pyrophosphatase MutT (NUDIX family)
LPKISNISEIKNKLNNKKASVLFDQHYNQFAVLLPLAMHENKLSLLFEVRAKNLTYQPGEICFPGGQIEIEDSSPVAAAVRETSEELGIATTDIEILGPLNTLLTPFQYRIFPFVAFIKENTLLQPTKAEVDKLFFIPLDYLLTCQPLISYLDITMQPNKNFPYHLIPGGANYPWKKGKYPVYFYNYEHYTVWGITARILHHFLELV